MALERPVNATRQQAYAKTIPPTSNAE